MKKLIKFLFTLIVIVILIIVIPVVILYFTIADKTDEAPIDLYNENINLDNQIANLIDKSFSSTDDNIYFTLSEDELDLLIFAIIRNANNQYYNEGCSSDECKYITYTDIPSEIPVLGGKQVLAKHAYTKMTDESLNLYITLDVMGIKTNLNVGFKFTATDDKYTLTISKLGLGKLNLMSGFGKMLLNPVLSAVGFTEEDINQEITEKNIPVEFYMKDFSFTFNKSDLGEIINSFIDEEDDQSGMVSELINILASDNEILNLGFFTVNDENSFGVNLNLTELKYNPETDGVPLYQFNSDTYKEKMQLMLNSGLDEDNQELVSKFLLYGFNDLTEEEKLIIINIDFTPIGITDASMHLGLITPSSNDLDQIISNQLYPELENLSDEEIRIKIEENIINSILYSNNLVGKGYNYFYQDIDNEYHVLNISVEAVWLDIVDNKLGFKLIANINNTKICLFTNFDNQTPSSPKIEADFTELRVGTIEFSEEMKNSILELIKNSLSDSMQIVSIVDNKIIIDSNEFLEEFQSDDSLSDFLTVIKNENLISLNLLGVDLAANGDISFAIDLEKISNEEEFTVLDEITTPFDTTTFIENKTQTFIISNLSGDGKIIFTDTEFSKLIFDQTNGYSGFSNTSTLPDGTTNFTYQITGIIVEFTPEIVNIKFIIDINGMETVIEIEGDVITTTLEDRVEIVLRDTIKLGEITTSNNFLLDILGNNLNNFGIMEYNSTAKSFIITANSFEEFMAIGGGDTPLNVDKIRITSNQLEVFVSYTDPLLESLIDNVSSVIESALGNDFLDPTQFDTTDPNQEQAVQDLNSTLEDISTILSDPEQDLTDELTDELINNINQLSTENQQEFLEQLETQADSQDLLDLYNTLFGN